MICFVFDEKKATDAAAYLLSLNNNRLPYMKLMKLLYIADRVSLSEYHYSITTDSYYSMKFGPVVSGIYDCIRHWNDLPDDSPWKRTIYINKERYEAVLTDENNPFDMLSEEEKDILRDANNGHDSENQFELSQFTHSFPEWKDPGNSRIPLSIEEIINATVKDEKEKKEALSDLDLTAELQRISYRNRGING
jgi:hypothetical protein